MHGVGASSILVNTNQAVHRHARTQPTARDNRARCFGVHTRLVADDNGGVRWMEMMSTDDECFPALVQFNYIIYLGAYLSIIYLRIADVGTTVCA